MIGDNEGTMLQLTATIVRAHVAHNAVEAAAVPDLIRSVHHALSAAAQPTPSRPAAPAPAVDPRRSVYDDHIVCLEDGQHLKMLKLHLSAAHGLTPEQYREKWGLPASYPMIAPRHAGVRAGIAKNSGLGRRRSDQEATTETAAAPEGPKVTVGKARRARGSRG